MVVAPEAGGKGTVLMPKQATIIKKKVNKIFVPACLFIAAKIRRIGGMDHLKNKFNTVELTTMQSGRLLFHHICLFFENKKRAGDANPFIIKIFVAH